jgi:hypothetical protein
VHKDIGHLQVTMDYIFVSQVLQPQVNVLNDGDRALLWKVPPASQLGLKISLITQLSYNVAVSIAREHLEASQNVGMAKFLEDLNLRKEQLFEFLGLEWIKLDYFYGHGVICELNLQVLVTSLWAL